MKSIRKASKKEEELIELLIEKASIDINPAWKNNLLVESMADGGMGSLLLIPEAVERRNTRFFGKEVSTYEFMDIDGIVVSASLNLDKKGQLYELDLLKMDFSPLKELPDL